jgi:hypothetical protein
MTSYRERRRQRDRQTEILRRLRVLDKAVQNIRAHLAKKLEAACLPTLVDFAYMEPFNRLLDPRSSEDPGFLDNDNANEARDRSLLSCAKSWRVDIDKKLAVIMFSYDPSFTVDQLVLAFVAFDCQECSATMIEYPEVIAHRCCYAKAKPDPDDIFFHEIANFSPNTGRLSWSCLSLRPASPSILDARKEAIRACGKDPLQDSRVIMDFLELNLSCNECISQGMTPQDAVAGTWRAAVG